MGEENKEVIEGVKKDESLDIQSLMSNVEVNDSEE